MNVYRLLVLGATYFLVALVQRLSAAVAVLLLGLAICAFLYGLEKYLEGKRK